MLSVILPAYNEEHVITKATTIIKEILSAENIDFELIFVDDGSKDKTWLNILNESKKDSRIRGLRFSKNFGKDSAILSGLTESNGDCVVVIDCDLQHPPMKIIDMYRLWEQGYEVVEGIKANRGKEGFLYSKFSKLFYDLISKATKINMSNASDFKLLDKKVVNIIIDMPEKNMFFRAMSSWVGFKSIQIEYDVQAREFGKSKWSTKSLIKYAIANLTSFTTLPMQIVTILGIFMFFVSIILSINALLQKIAGISLDGFTTVIILQAFSGSIIMLSLGIIGYYISKIYDEVKRRPRYIISEKTKPSKQNTIKSHK